ncbi:hypothetical protein [Chitiniphilus eburneus]|uniref:hypothetical protein n=1 Tax=Chitiniphilus eburneus TaxID=2571148 RepID=UPI0035CF1858
MGINKPSNAARADGIFVGSRDEALRHLQLQPQSSQVVTVVIEHPDADIALGAANAIAALLSHDISHDISVAQKQQRFAALIDLLVDPVPEPTRILALAGMRASAHQAVFADGDWLSTAEVAKVAGLDANSRQAQRWKRAGRLFAVRSKGRDYFPAYGLDVRHDHRPLPALAEVLRLFAGNKTAWQVAVWFSSVNSFLGGKRPKDLLATAPAHVVAAAEDELVGPVHG